MRDWIVLLRTPPCALPEPNDRVLRLVKIDHSVTYVPGGPSFAPFPYYNTFCGYYGAVYPVVYTPDYLKEEKRYALRPSSMQSHPVGENSFGPALLIRSTRRMSRER